jgi:hypothetical protein
LRIDQSSPNPHLTQPRGRGHEAAPQQPTRPQQEERAGASDRTRRSRATWHEPDAPTR